jgi:hypothetical protein
VGGGGGGVEVVSHGVEGVGVGEVHSGLVGAGGGPHPPLLSAAGEP